jgi:hypothetical protein
VSRWSFQPQLQTTATSLLLRTEKSKQKCIHRLRRSFCVICGCRFTQPRRLVPVVLTFNSVAVLANFFGCGQFAHHL